MEEKLIEALNDLLAKKQEILGHIEFCRDGLSEDYKYLFDNAERVGKKRSTALNFGRATTM